jgi:hypothetical protein
MFITHTPQIYKIYGARPYGATEITFYQGSYHGSDQTKIIISSFLDNKVLSTYNVRTAYKSTRSLVSYPT